MSLKKRRERAAAEAALEKQEDEIRQAFKRDKLAKAMGEIEAERVFKPITKRLEPPLPPEEAVGPDYGMEEFDRINPFDWQEAFQPEPVLNLAPSPL